VANTDEELIRRIGELADQERALEEAHRSDPLSAEEHERLKGIEVTLDQLWDLLRQRRALREAGRSPEDAQPRPEGVVEGYLQ
jgi:Protein of unknown function (DUF2630)